MLALISAERNLTIAAISPDGRFVLFVDAKHPGILRRWDIDSNTELKGFTQAAPVTATAISSDSRRVLVGCEDGTLHLLALPSGSEICKLAGHTGKVTAIAFSADGRMAASGSEDKTVRVWKLPPSEH